MSTKKRTKFERSDDLRHIAAQYLRGVQQSEIAAQLGVTQQQISYDLKQIQKQWAAASVVDLNEAKNRELERIDELEREYWAAWERSKGERTKTRQEGAGKDAQGRTIVKRAVAEKEQMLGNPQYLAGIMSCVSERCKLLGLYAPQKQDISGKLSGSVGISVEDWRVKQEAVKAKIAETLVEFAE